MTKITKGCYVKTSEIKDTEEWKKVIDAFVKAGFNPYHGYGQYCEYDHSTYWQNMKYIGVDWDGDTVHSDFVSIYVEDPTELSVKDVLSTLVKQIEYLFVNDLSINMNQTKEERVSELGEEGWILGGIEPTGTYVFYREKK